MDRTPATETNAAAEAPDTHDQAAPPILAAHLRAIQDDFQALKRPGGRPADKAWFDSLWS